MTTAESIALVDVGPCVVWLDADEYRELAMAWHLERIVRPLDARPSVRTRSGPALLEVRHPLPTPAEVAVAVEAALP
jgi:hypothetical protein